MDNTVAIYNPDVFSLSKCEYCWEECICAFVKMPPCNFCTSHSICDVCGKLFCSELIDKTDEESKDIRCPECL